MTRPDPAWVIAAALPNGLTIGPDIGQYSVAGIALDALHAAGFMLLHQDDRERLVEAVVALWSQAGEVTEAGQSVASKTVDAIFDTLRGEEQ